MAHEQQQPMSDARLAELNASVERLARISERGSYAEQAWFAWLEMVDELQRLRAREAALVEVVERVAEAPVAIYELMHWACLPASYKEQARALLASDSADEAPVSTRVCPKCGHELTSSWRPNEAAFYCHGCGWYGDTAASGDEAK